MCNSHESKILLQQQQDYCEETFQQFKRKIISLNQVFMFVVGGVHRIGSQVAKYKFSAISQDKEQNDLKYLICMASWIRRPWNTTTQCKYLLKNTRQLLQYPSSSRTKQITIILKSWTFHQIPLRQRNQPNAFNLHKNISTGKSQHTQTSIYQWQPNDIHLYHMSSVCSMRWILPE